MTDETKEPIVARLADFIRANAGHMDDEVRALFRELKVELELQNVAARDRDVNARQRDFLGGQVSAWIGRFYGLKVAAGDLMPGVLPQIVANEVGALEQGCAAIANQEPSA